MSIIFSQTAVRPLLICGPSGVGKGTLLNRLFSDFPALFGFSVSHTTRKPRPGEEDGVHYHFVSKEHMQREIAQNKFIEHANVHGNFYGTSNEAVRAVAKAGKCCVLDIDTQGAIQVVKHSDLNPFSVFVKPPSVDELEKRLRGRNTETEEVVQLRIGNAKEEIRMAEEDKDGIFDYTIVNDDLDRAYEELKDTIQKNIGIKLE